MSHSELEAESHRSEVLAQENTSLRSQLEELHQRVSGGEEVDFAATAKQRLEEVQGIGGIAYAPVDLPGNVVAGYLN